MASVLFRVQGTLTSGVEIQVVYGDEGRLYQESWWHRWLTSYQDDINAYVTIANPDTQEKTTWPIHKANVRSLEPMWLDAYKSALPPTTDTSLLKWQHAVFSMQNVLEIAQRHTTPQERISSGIVLQRHLTEALSHGRHGPTWSRGQAFLERATVLDFKIAPKQIVNLVAQLPFF